jgi:hypothetical protein
MFAGVEIEMYLSKGKLKSARGFFVFHDLGFLDEKYSVSKRDTLAKNPPRSRHERLSLKSFQYTDPARVRADSSRSPVLDGNHPQVSQIT